ncbi:hypothetical protein K461DRAFT_290595 [Myriangium duriaei CBS 260.36]|uniref:YCII-related domain-containing protein n=1 Tax=Myriangium duriaei CBS 260.36 TaxID=1168546 RepID=A0A9P4MQF9_9PEZI|nr:hypothetical protein K461DRAFT_290595 [Myriangium duriaei CBS 260.36]
MASKNEWLVIVKDKPNTLPERMKVRPQHLTNIGPLVSDGRVTMGGATLTSQPVEGQKLEIDGSALMVQAETREEVVQILEKDIYATSGVWDVENAQILPFKTAVRKGL